MDNVSLALYVDILYSYVTNGPAAILPVTYASLAEEPSLNMEIS